MKRVHYTVGSWGSIAQDLTILQLLGTNIIPSNVDPDYAILSFLHLNVVKKQEGVTAKNDEMP